MSLCVCGHDKHWRKCTSCECQFRGPNPDPIYRYRVEYSDPWGHRFTATVDASTTDEARRIVRETRYVSSRLLGPVKNLGRRSVAPAASGRA